MQQGPSLLQTHRNLRLFSSRSPSVRYPLFPFARFLLLLCFLFSYFLEATQRAHRAFCWGCFCLFFSPDRSGSSAERHLFLEATQRNTECTVCRALWVESVGAEIQVAGIGPGFCRGPAVPSVADAIQRTVSLVVPAVVEARGRCRSALEPSCVYPNKGRAP